MLYVLLLALSLTFGPRSTIAGGISSDDSHLLKYRAIMNLTYVDPWTGETRSEEEDSGLYAADSRLEDESGWVVHIRTTDGTNDGCTQPVNAPPAGDKWIALIERGACRFHQKIVNVAVLLNASAVIVYNNEYDQLLTMKHKVDTVVSVFIKKQSGERIAALVDNGTRVWMHVSVGVPQHFSYSQVNRTSVLFVSVSFIILMVISLAWLVFYYVQRFRYMHTKDRLAKRLMSAAKKAVNKMGQRVIRKGDKEVDSEFDLCAICVEMYKVAETVRVLPCKHIFHKGCVDPWLIEHRTCPICKLDILHAYGMHVLVNRELTTTTNLDFPFLLPGESSAIDDAEAGVERHDSREDARCGSVSIVADRGTDRELLLDDGRPGSECAPASGQQRGVIRKELAQVHSSIDDTQSREETLNDGIYDADDDTTKLSSVEQC